MFILLLYGIPLAMLILIAWKGMSMYNGLKEHRGNEVSLRMEKTRLISRLLLYAIVPACIAVFLFSLGFGFSGNAALAVTFICGFALRVMSTTYKNRYNKDFKENFVTAELSRVFDDLKLDPCGLFDANELEKLDLFKACKRTRGNDLISASYKGRAFVQGDVFVDDYYQVEQQEEDENGNTRTVVRDVYPEVFRGRVMRFEFEKPFSGAVQVLRRDFGAGRRVDSMAGWQQVETELAVFADTFLIYAKDPLDAMRVMTPQMVEAIHYLDQKLNVPLAFHFEGNFMYAVMALARDAFDVSGGKTLTEERKLLDEDISLITGFLDNMYFKGDSNSAGEKISGDAPVVRTGVVVPPRDTGEESASGFSVAALLAGLPLIGGFFSQSNRFGIKLRGPAKLLCSVLNWLPLIAWLALAVWTWTECPDSVVTGYKTVDGVTTVRGTMSTPIFLGIMAVVNIPCTLIAGDRFSEGLAYFLLAGGRGVGLSSRVFTLMKSVIVGFIFMIPMEMHQSFVEVTLSV